MIARGRGCRRARLADLAAQGIRRRHRRRRVRARSGNHRRGRAGSSRLGRRLRPRARPGPGAGRRGPGEISCDGRGFRHARSAARPRARRQLFAGDAAADRGGRGRRCRCCNSIPSGLSRASDEARRALEWARERLAQGPVLIASSSTPDQVARRAGPPRPGCSGPCDRAGDGRHRRRPGRNPACGGWWSPAAKPPARWWTGWAFPAFWWARRSPPAFRCCARSGRGRRDAAGAEVRQFRRSGILRRCAQADALSSGPAHGLRDRVPLACAARSIGPVNFVASRQL